MNLQRVITGATMRAAALQLSSSAEPSGLTKSTGGSVQYLMMRVMLMGT